MKKTIFILIVAIIFIAVSCVKTTVNFDKFSENVALSPSYVLSAVKGDVTLIDLIEPNDTLVVDQDNALKLVFREDSVINYALSDFYTSFPAATFGKTFILAAVSLTNIEDTIDVDPGSGIKVKEIKVLSGTIDWTLTSWCDFDIQVNMLFPTVDDSGSPMTATMSVTANSTNSGTISLAGKVVSLDSDPAIPFNRIPVTYDIITGPVTIDPFDSVRVDISMSQPEFDYSRGYFGMQSVSTDNDTIDPDMDELFSKITGDIYLSNPIIRINYENSFGIPMRVEALATGKNATEQVDLNRGPVDLDYPSGPANRVVSSTFEVNKDNSQLPELVSMLPNEIIFSGSASANPDGETAQDNWVFGNSAFKADVEIEVPFEFRITDLQLADTLDNFLLNDDPGSDSPLDMLSKLRLEMFVKNGFPLGGDINIQLYDSASATLMESVTTNDLFAPADVDAGGRVIAPVEHNSSIELTEAFLADASVADKMILKFTLYTTDHGAKDVKIYSDYGIEFKAGLYVKADLTNSK